MKINIKHLYQFFLAAKEGSIKQAAKILHVTEPTVSKQIRDLEDAIDIPLFDRQNRKLNLSSEGKIILDKSEKIFQLVTELEYLIGKKQFGHNNVLSVGSMYLVHQKLNWALKKGFLRDQDCMFSFKHGDFSTLLGYLEAQKIDLILADYPYVSNAKEYRTFKVSPEIRLVAVGNKKFKSKSGGLLHFLESAPLISFDPSFKLQMDLDYYFQLKGIKPQKILEFQCPTQVRYAAEQGYGIAILPYDLVVKQLERGTLQKIGDVDFAALECWVITLSARSSESLIRRFITNFLASQKDEEQKKSSQ